MPFFTLCAYCWAACSKYETANCAILPFASSWVCLAGFAVCFYLFCVEVLLSAAGLADTKRNGWVIAVASVLNLCGYWDVVVAVSLIVYFDGVIYTKSPRRIFYFVLSQNSFLRQPLALTPAGNRGSMRFCRFFTYFIPTSMQTADFLPYACGGWHINHPRCRTLKTKN